MKNYLFVIAAGFLLLSCSETTSVDSIEEIQNNAFESYEFKTLQTTYDEYVKIEASIVDVFDKEVISKLSKSELDSRQEAYVQKLANKMFQVKRERDVFLNKYPNVIQNMSSDELRKILRRENQ